MFDGMREEESGHRRRLIELYQAKFGEHIPLIRRNDVKGFIDRRPIWLTKPLRLDAVRKEAATMEVETRRWELLEEVPPVCAPGDGEGEEGAAAGDAAGDVAAAGVAGADDPRQLDLALRELARMRDGWDGLKTMRVVDAARRAATERRWVRV